MLDSNLNPQVVYGQHELEILVIEERKIAAIFYSFLLDVVEVVETQQ
jgi:hypothetical protein